VEINFLPVPLGVFLGKADSVAKVDVHRAANEEIQFDPVFVFGFYDATRASIGYLRNVNGARAGDHAVGFVVYRRSNVAVVMNNSQFSLFLAGIRKAILSADSSGVSCNTDNP
jgi:hypothetical protein